MGLMPPPRYGGTPVDWDSIARSWGRPFPLDHRRFIEVYGAGAIEDFLVVVGPQPKVPFEDAGWNGMVHETGTAEGTWEDTRKSPELEGASPYLITWGVSSNADIFCWDATGEDPSSWPVLVFDRGDSMFSRYDCGMVEFLTRTLRGDFPEVPLKGDVFLWDTGEATWEKTLSSTTDVDILTGLMPLPQERGTPVDWDPIGRSWGRWFPHDYRRFIEVYGAGTIQDFLAVVGPEPKVPFEDTGRDGMVAATGTAEGMWDMAFKSPELEGTSPYLITWGISINADLFCWDATGEDAAGWPVLVYDRGNGMFSRYDCGMAEFLTRMLRGDFPKSPLTEPVVLWGKGEATWEKE
ncbi:hypothetical protein Atai01_66420 [Amycolatopsis taiwanensis]|uniref:Knr4/Smi1-like domain-containing protein n=2 Tax=Amycolatopsis taiwanensis TaxID=342230 RepID=A0A9W6R690_9PSEU|nr:hypothetical protein Atai01_66420 [Amycolatopsis taiwanensis]